MELIAASRIVRAQLAITAAKPYAERMSDVVGEIAATPEAKDHWLFAGGGDRPLVVVLAADRGLSGAFNVSVLRAADELLRRLSRRAGAPALIAVGRRAVSYFRFNGRAMAESFEGLSDRPRFEDAQKIVAAITHELERGTIGEIYLVSTRFLSVGSQKVETRRLVPLDLPERKSQHRLRVRTGPRPDIGPPAAPLARSRGLPRPPRIGRFFPCGPAKSHESGYRQRRRPHQGLE